MQDLARTSQALAGDGHAGADDPRRGGVPALPAARARPLGASSARRSSCKLSGQDTELDRTVVDALGDPLVHLVRNALDHGLESPEERVAAGKDPTGTLEISARHAGGSVLITVSDDGHGVDPARVARKAVERGLIPADAGRLDRHAARARAAVRARLLDRRGDERRLRPRRRHGRRPHDDPRARRRGAPPVHARRGDEGADPAAADARDRGRARDRVARRAVRDAARPGRADAASSTTSRCARSPAARCSSSGTASCRSSTSPRRSATAARRRPTTR